MGVNDRRYVLQKGNLFLQADCHLSDYSVEWVELHSATLHSPRMLESFLKRHPVNPAVALPDDDQLSIVTFQSALKAYQEAALEKVRKKWLAEFERQANKAYGEHVISQSIGDYSGLFYSRGMRIDQAVNTLGVQMGIKQLADTE